MKRNLFGAKQAAPSQLNERQQDGARRAIAQALAPTIRRP